MYRMIYYDCKISIKKKKGVDIQPNMYGLFFEDINYAADGGLYAEMVENRSFEERMHARGDSGTKDTWAEPGYAWSTDDGKMEYNTENPLNEKNLHYLAFEGKSFKNRAYDPTDKQTGEGGMYIEQGKDYKISFYARSFSYNGGFSVRTVKDGKIGFSDKITSADETKSNYDGWKRYEKTVTAIETVRHADFVIELDESAAVDFDVISVMPCDAAAGLFRRDLAEKLQDLNPGFLRFPGGCIIEGWDLDNAYNWKDSVGPIEERKQNWNRWATKEGSEPYNQTYGLGYYEYFILCEYLGCEPVPVQNVGMACEYQGGKDGNNCVDVFEADGVTYTAEFYKYIQDTLDLIEFANSVDFKSSKWARLRRDMGHSEPFRLNKIGIGNEQWQWNNNNWYARYEAFEKEIHKHYPDMKLISSSGPVKSDEDSPEGSFSGAWKWIRSNQENNCKFTYAVDEHYYADANWFLENDCRYDEYDRKTKVFAGEYAARTSLTDVPEEKNNLQSAIAEAAFMTGLERNADVVYRASYAPLFARIGRIQWHPDMIWFDDASSYCTPDYWVQHMYMNNNGSYTLISEITKSNDKVYQTASFDEESGDIIIKLVNPFEYEQKILLELDSAFDITGKAEVITLSSDDWADLNSIAQPEKVRPSYKNVDVTANSEYIFPKMSFVILRIHTTEGKHETKKAVSQ